MTTRLRILGANDPEMEAIEKLLRDRGETVVYATTIGGKRVSAGNAYLADSPRHAAIANNGEVRIYAVECDWRHLDGETGDVTVIDHHRHGDPGYGRPPSEFMAASSVGQVLYLLNKNFTGELLMVAAADHCLAHAYRAECPGVDPDRLAAWRAESRAKFQGRPVADVLADVDRARTALQAAPLIYLGTQRAVDRDADGVCPECEDSMDPCWGTCHGDHDPARDMRGQHVPELPEASAREGICFIADSLPDDSGKVKVVCQSGTPEQIEAFMSHWAPAQGLTNIYGDPARGFAGGYLPAKS
jgi:hypothetical protein